MISASPFTAAIRFFLPQTGSLRRSDYTLLAQIRDSAPELKVFSNNELAVRYSNLRKHINKTAVTDDFILIPVFTLVVEALERVLKINLYDVQLLAALALARGCIVEMQTGEGKTFTALAPACLHALTGNGVHIMTVNPYLAKRDYEQLAPVYRLLGLSVGLLESETDSTTKQAAYACDITYGPGYEFGFDYLRDQTALIAQHKPILGENFYKNLRGQEIEHSQQIQRGHAFAIIDEADSVMIDEAATPLVLAAGGNEPAHNTVVYLEAMHTANLLEIDRHFLVEEAIAKLKLTQQGLAFLNKCSKGTFHKGLERPWRIYIEQALRAKLFFQRDVDYTVRNGKVLIVDQKTGRIFTNRSWNEGLHQAVQAKEQVIITTETKSLARISRQRYFRLYKKLCGMTGTAKGREQELRSVYDVNVAMFPPHKPCQRITMPIRLFSDRSSKEQAIVAEIISIRQMGRPILIGTRTIESSMRLADLLDQHGLNYQLLNGVQDAEEAEIVSRAGRKETVTIATNMAGRGTDIKLGPGVTELGGLHVIISEPHDSTHVDRQLIGRAARQGDPGSCRMFASPEDQLFAQHAPKLIHQLINRAEGKSETQIASMAAEKISKIQQHVELTQTQSRRQMFLHDDWLEKVLCDLTSSK